MEDNSQNLENKKTKKRTTKSNMSKNEKYFWGTIVVFLIVFIAISLIALYKINSSSSKENEKDKKPIIVEKWLELPSQRIRENLSQNQERIKENLNLQIEKINSKIDDEVDMLFEKVINENIENFLDFHYSLVGGYVELGTMAFSDYDKYINEKLLGNDFFDKLEKSSKIITNFYENSMKNHQDFVESISTDQVDLELNSKALASIKEEINNNFMQQKIKLGVVGAAIGAKVTALVSAKITAKTAITSGAKAGTKLAASAGGAVAGASAGLFCGPGSIICSPLGAIVGGAIFWFGTDAAINAVDETLHREELKEEILSSINETKMELKNSYVSSFEHEIVRFSEQIQESYKNVEIKEKKKIIDYIK
ncbi:hypothetical protein [Sulfurimonas sp.]|uniref:hypothetical protein n=1 Tax=Sulfurimonas sp. TaxID=2022749 RepID=UPI0025D969F9|nr:hypothetical protein [Sulfurimonas sp.]MBW6487832.1 hypothetical protein [Sulfurimonas sp.]